RHLRVVLVDDDLARRDRYTETWTDIFHLADIEVALEYIDDADEVDRKLMERPHVVVMDNVFEREENGKRREVDNVGVELICKRKPKHQDTVFVLYSQNSFSIDQLGIRFPNPDLIVTKTHMARENYRRYIGMRIAELVRRLPFEN